MNERRLEIGGGETPLTSHEQLNEGWGERPLPFPDATFAEVYTQHCIEHLPWWQVPGAVKEAFRVLVPGGTFEAHTVDFRVLVECYLNRRAGDVWPARGKNPENHWFRWIASRLFCVGETPADPLWHKGIFDFEYLVELLAGAGFVGLERMATPRGPQKHGIINVGIRGRKP